MLKTLYGVLADCNHLHTLSGIELIAFYGINNPDQFINQWIWILVKVDEKGNNVVVNCILDESRCE